MHAEQELWGRRAEAVLQWWTQDEETQWLVPKTDAQGQWTMPQDRRAGKVEAGSTPQGISDLRTVGVDPAPC